MKGAMRYPARMNPTFSIVGASAGRKKMRRVFRIPMTAAASDTMSRKGS